MTRLADWQKHVQTSERSTRLICGATWEPMEFYLSDANHARDCIDEETRIQPCPACLARILAEIS